MSINAVTLNQSVVAKSAQKDCDYERDQDRWIQYIPHAIGTGSSLFQKMQFIVKSKDEEFGSPWQKAICKHCNVPPEHQFKYWQHLGMKKSRTALNRRRQTVTQAMKKQFLRTKWEMENVLNCAICVFRRCTH